jgi:outer membrane protein assembly factor BamB
VYALAVTDGRVRWRYKTAGPVYSSPAVSDGILYVGTVSRFFYALHAKSGRMRLQFKPFFPVYSSPAVSGGTVYFCHYEGILYAVHGAATNRPIEHRVAPYLLQLWIFGLAPRPKPQSGYLWRKDIGHRAFSSPVVTADALFVGADDRLVAVDLASHEILWEVQTSGAVESSPAVSGTTVYFGSEDGHLYAVDAETGMERWSYLTGGKITSSPAVADGTVYVGSHDGNVYAIR